MSSLPLIGSPATTAEGWRNWMLKATMPMPKRKAIEVKVKALRSGFMGCCPARDQPTNASLAAQFPKKSPQEIKTSSASSVDIGCGGAGFAGAHGAQPSSKSRQRWYRLHQMGLPLTIARLFSQPQFP